MKINEVEAKCRAAIARAEAYGVAVEPTLFSNPNLGRCCLFGAVRGFDIHRGAYDEVAASDLGLSVEDAKCLEGGFMGWQMRQWQARPDLYALGQTLRVEQLAKNPPESAS